MVYDILESPLGKITVAGEDGFLSELHIEGDKNFAKVPKDWVLDKKKFVGVKKELSEYFAGKRKDFDIKIKMEGTDFRKMVWRELGKIKYGETVSYGDLAKRVGRPEAVRAVSMAIAKNHICIIVPCHRVISSNGGIGGYVAGVEKKSYLLNLEKIRGRKKVVR